ncbi:hypothetical protein [Sphingosinicella sp. CPCC 101087]|uniref:hypothetical protein n=1 Tax=Sphingosinicella sp. CPCC 101087 TaxID=2497754 RepID=UPI00101C3E4A|nr:hypothetical protein [Sphingosinicella sp. CPCC 101087]
MSAALRLLPFLLLAWFGQASARELEIPAVRYPALPAVADDVDGFVPPGWRVERIARGDLNEDGAEDLAFVIRMQDRRNILDHDRFGARPFDTNPRILAVALANRAGGYRLAVQNHALIPRRENPTIEDPFHSEDTDFDIERRALRLSLYRFMSAGGWNAGHTTFTFRWQDDALRLIGYDYSDVGRSTGKTVEVSINFLTHRARTAIGNIEQDDEHVRWTRIARRPLLAIGEIGDGLAFDPQGLLSALP